MSDAADVPSIAAPLAASGHTGSEGGSREQHPSMLQIKATMH